MSLKRAEEIQIFYEISMSIRPGASFESILKPTLGKILRTLNLSAGCVLQSKACETEGSHLEPIFMLPKIPGLNRAAKIASLSMGGHLPSEKLDQTESAFPYAARSQEGETAYFFDLPGFGMMVLLKSEGALKTSAIRSLALLNEKLGQALNACAQKEALARSEERLAKLNKQLQKWDADKLAFIRYIAHELNTPLNWIASLDMIEEQNLPEVDRMYMEFVRKGFSRISKLTQLASSYFEKASFNEPGERCEVLLSDMQKELGERFATRARGREVPLTFAGNWARKITVDAEGLREVLNSLLENAIGFCKPGKAVTISLDEVEGRHVLRVADEGVGIEANLVEEIFKPCQIPEHKRSPEGYGFSLPRAKLVCDANDWELLVESQGVGQGSCFELRL